jgi:malonyl-CoA O-methyltransferase
LQSNYLERDIRCGKIVVMLLSGLGVRHFYNGYKRSLSMNVNKSLVSRRFNRAAATYDQHATVQIQMARQLMQRLQTDQQVVTSICEIGCGTGYLTDLLAKKYPDVQIVAIDFAPHMIEIAKTKVNHSNVTWITGDAEEVYRAIDHQFDVIISNATIQWFDRPLETVSSWSKLLRPNGWFLASTFGEDTFHELTTLFHQVEKELRISKGQHRLSMRDMQFWKQLWKQQGLVSVVAEEDKQQTTYNNSRCFLQSIKATGANYSEADLNVLTTRRLLQKVMDRYNQIYQLGSQVYATYHVIYISGQKCI